MSEVERPKNNCHFFNWGTGNCVKGLSCRFPHVDWQGIDWKKKMAKSGKGPKTAPLGEVSPKLNEEGEPENLMPLGVVENPQELTPEVRKIYKDWHLMKAKGFTDEAGDENKEQEEEEKNRLVVEERLASEFGLIDAEVEGEEEYERNYLDIDATRLKFEEVLDEIREIKPLVPQPFYRAPVTIKVNEMKKKRMPYESFFSVEKDIEIKVGEKRILCGRVCYTAAEKKQCRMLSHASG